MNSWIDGWIGGLITLLGKVGNSEPSWWLSRRSLDHSIFFSFFWLLLFYCQLGAHYPATTLPHVYIVALFAYFTGWIHTLTHHHLQFKDVNKLAQSFRISNDDANILNTEDWLIKQQQKINSNFKRYIVKRFGRLKEWMKNLFQRFGNSFFSLFYFIHCDVHHHFFSYHHFWHCFVSGNGHLGGHCHSPNFLFSFSLNGRQLVCPFVIFFFSFFLSFYCWIDVATAVAAVAAASIRYVHKSGGCS